MNLELIDKIAIVTGSSRGLGLASATALAREGCRVTLCARTAARLAEAAAEVAAACGDASRVFTVQADVSTPDGVAAIVEGAVARFGGLDILVNNVGLARGADLLATTDADWQEAIDQTLMPAVRASKLAVPHMKARGGGVILMIASIFGRETGGRMTYNAVKAAEISLAKSLAQQLARDNIRVNSVAPGSILFPEGRGGSASRPTRRASRSSWHASCRSAASGRRRRWPTSSRSSPRRGPAGSAAPASLSTAASHGRSSEGSR